MTKFGTLDVEIVYEKSCFSLSSRLGFSCEPSPPPSVWPLAHRREHSSFSLLFLSSMALLVPCPFAPLLLPPPPEPLPLVFLIELPVECSPHVLSVPPHPPDLSLFLCGFFDSAVTILSVRLVTLSVSVIFVLVVFCDSSTAVCGLNSGFYPACYNFVMFDFGFLIYWPQVSQIYVYTVVFDIKSDMVSGWNCESVSCAFASVSWLLIVLDFIVHLSRCLESWQSLIENEVIALFGLGFLFSVLRCMFCFLTIGGNLERKATVFASLQCITFVRSHEDLVAHCPGYVGVMASRVECNQVPFELLAVTEVDENIGLCQTRLKSKN
ncbi:Uncharacterized protein Rs2_12879 [Raphanus sativus]|nr:Uncharacterized protein Rs2_12879 [Raphanus sativus]